MQLASNYFTVYNNVFEFAGTPKISHSQHLTFSLPFHPLVDEVEEIEEIDIEARGLLDPGQKDDIMDCMGNIANKFLTAIDSLQGFANCMKKVK